MPVPALDRPHLNRDPLHPSLPVLGCLYSDGVLVGLFIIHLCSPFRILFVVITNVHPSKSSWAEQLMFAAGPPSWWTYVVGDRR
jgi:hypothetical protein